MRELNFGGNGQKYRGLSIVCAFNHKADILYKEGNRSSSMEYIAMWYDSIQLHSGMEGVVLHTMFDDNFVAKYQTAQVKFVQVDAQNPGLLRGQFRPINDQRFMVLEHFFQDPMLFDRSRHDYVLLTDARDVQFLRNPFEYMHRMDRLIGQPQLYIGDEYNSGPVNYIFVNKQWKACLQQPFKNNRIFNVGIIGGHLEVVENLVKDMNIFLDERPENVICDQATFQYLVSAKYEDKLIAGYPLNSRMFKHQTAENTKAFIAHK